MTEFRKIRRFTGTKKHAETHVFLQFRNTDYSSNWTDVLDITKLGPFIEVIPWESNEDEASFKKAQEAEYRKALR